MKRYTDKLSLSNKVFRILFNITTIPISLIPGKELNFLYISILKMFGAKIGKGCIVYNSAKVWDPRNLKLGEYSVIGPKALVYNVGRIIIGNEVQLSQYSKLITASHNYNVLTHELITKPIVIEDNVWIAAYASILPGVTLKRNSIAGYGSIVTKDVEPYCIVAGNPARTVAKREEF